MADEQDPTEALGAQVARMMHLGREGLAQGDSPGPSITPTSVYHLPGAAEGPHQYGRWSNPTWDALEDALAMLEGADTAIFPSGMAAIAATAQSILRPGDVALIPEDGYYATRALIGEALARLGVHARMYPTPALGGQSFAGVRLVWIETPSNPSLDVCDIAAAAARARSAGALLVVDNTTATPLGQRPLELGAHALVSSDTKAVNGHSDVLLGHVSSNEAWLMSATRDWRKLWGAIPGPFEAWAAHRGLETLEVRFERMCASAALVAERLAAHPAVVETRYPGLASDPSHALAARQMRRYGSMIGATFRDAAAAERFIAGCPLLRPTTSFGGVHSSAERRARWGDAVAEGFVRISIGCEPTEALVSAIETALSSALDGSEA